MKSPVTGNRPAWQWAMATQLSPRQREILDLVAEGRTSKEIAVILGISESTVNWHLANAFERLGASSRAEAVAIAMRSNGNDHVNEPRGPARFPAARFGWPRLVAIALAIAVAGALLGGAAVATFRLGVPAPTDVPSASPASSPGSPTSSPASGTRGDVVGDQIGTEPDPDPTAAPVPTSPAELVPTVGAPLLSPSLPAAPLPTLPVTPPPLPSLPLPTPIPTPHLPLP
jgi:DNA-binding CsgD family transcriptional regulator